jgi:ketosteroid isomerase-like protein
MSRENLDLVRSIYAAQERGDYSSADWAHPDIEFEISDGPSPGRWTGLAAMAEAWRDFLNAWEEWRTEADEYRALDGGRVLVLAHSGGRGKASRAEVARMWTEGAAVCDLRDGKVTKLVVYLDREHAFADLGLSSEAGLSE